MSIFDNLFKKKDKQSTSHSKTINVFATVVSMMQNFRQGQTSSLPEFVYETASSQEKRDIMDVLHQNGLELLHRLDSNGMRVCVISKIQDKNSLKYRASQNFDLYLKDFLSKGDSYKLPASRLTEQEWQELNQELLPTGVQLYQTQTPNGLYMVMRRVAQPAQGKKDLRNRASRHFEQYLQEFKQSGEDIGLPAERLTEQEWKELNQELLSSGVQLVSKFRNGTEYMWFTNVMQEKQQFNKGTDALRSRMFEKIHEKYPLLSNETINRILSSNERDVNNIYEIIRHKETPYFDTKKQDFEDAIYYILQNSKNKDNFLMDSDYRDLCMWNPTEKEMQMLNRPSVYNTVMLSSYQDWTWMRYVGRYRSKDIKFHMSLNVKITPEV